MNEEYITINYSSLRVPIKNIVNENGRDSTDVVSVFISVDGKDLIINFKPNSEEEYK